MTKRGYDAIAGPGNVLQCPVCMETNHANIAQTHDGRLRCCSGAIGDWLFQCGYTGDYAQWRVSEKLVKKEKVQ